MAVVNGLTAERMLEIEASSVTGGEVDAYGQLILTTHGGDQIDAGNVASTAIVNGVDSDSVDVTVTGSGTPEIPYEVSAQVKQIPASAVSSGTLDFARIPTLVKSGLLHRSYRGNGPAQVKLDGDSSFTGPYKWLHPYRPSGSRTVKMLRDHSTEGWLIECQDDGGKLPITLASNWLPYNDSAVSYEWSWPRVQRLVSGIVILSGLVRVSGAVGNNTLIGTLPVGMRPDYSMLFGVNNSDVARFIKILANGDIMTGDSFSTDGYISLDGIAFPAAGVATWTTVQPQGTAGSQNAFANSWLNYLDGGGEYGPARFWKDPYGFVWTAGVVRSGTTTDNSTIFSMPTTHRVWKTHHIATASNSSLGIIGSNTASTGVDIKAGNTGNAWVSLCGATFVTQEARDNNPWRDFPRLVNNWANFTAASYQQAGELRREDGLTFLHGMLGSGTITGLFTFMHEECIPERDMLFNVASNAARGRLDIGGWINGPKRPGGLIAQQGSNAWFSLDSVKFMV